jgi:hypothetical protein
VATAGEFYICVTATRAALTTALLAEEASGATAAWVVDGAVRHPKEDAEGAAGYACCRHDGRTRRVATPYWRQVVNGGTQARATSSFDVELKAQTTAVENETEEGVVILFDATSPIGAAMSFARAHDRHRADFHCDADLAALTEAWEDHSVAYVHTKAHARVTVNEWAALGGAAERERERRQPHCSAGLDIPCKVADAYTYTASCARTKTWATAQLKEQERTREWLGSFSKRTPYARGRAI